SHSHTGRFNEVLHTFYTFVAEQKRPYAVRGTMEYVERGWVSGEGIYLPLTLDGNRTDRIPGAAVSKPLPRTSPGLSFPLLTPRGPWPRFPQHSKTELREWSWPETPKLANGSSPPSAVLWTNACVRVRTRCPKPTRGRTQSSRR